MSVIAASIRDEVATVLNAANIQPAPLTSPLVAQAIYDLTLRLDQLAGGRLVAMPQTKSPTLVTRGGGQRINVKIDVAVQFKFDAPDGATLDPWLNAAEAIADLFVGKA